MDRPSDGGNGGTDGPDAEKKEGGSEKPPSVREFVGPPPSGKAGGEGGEGEEGTEEPDEEDSASRPTPVRVAMEVPPPGDSRPREALPSRDFEDVEGEEWVVRVTGRTVAGSSPSDPGAPLMHLTFYRSDSPDIPRRELLTVEFPLDVFYDQDLRNFLERSRSVEEG